MICPVCTDRPLEPHSLFPTLPSRRCTQCRGNWISGERYYQWLDHPDRSSADVSADVVDATRPESTKAKLCPECGRLMTRYDVGKGVAFQIDRCGNCAGIWLDAAEFESLRSLGLADQIHFVFSAAWQAGLLREKQTRARNQILLERVGQADFDEITRVRNWLASHPHRRMLLTFLSEADPTPPKA